MVRTVLGFAIVLTIVLVTFIGACGSLFLTGAGLIMGSWLALAGAAGVFVFAALGAWGVLVIMNWVDRGPLW